MKRFAQFVIRFRITFIVISLLITGFFGFFLKDLRINPDITTYLPPDDSIVSRFKYIGEQYSSSSMGIIIIESDDVFSASTIEHINRITTTLQNTEGIDYVTSLTNVLDIKATADSSIEIGQLIDEYNLPTSLEQLLRLKAYTLSKKLYKGRLVSEDGRYATVICRINQDFDKNDVSEKIMEEVLALGFPEKMYFEGMPFQLLNIFEYVLKDLFLLIPLIIVLIAITLLISFRSFRGVWLPILTVAMGIIWTLGLMALIDVPLTPISDAIPVVLFAVGVAYSIHVINKFNTAVTDTSRRKEQSVKALQEVGLPVILAGLTTFMGFLSFIMGAYLIIIRDFGIFSSLGILFVLGLSVTFTPSVLSLLKPADQESLLRRAQGKNMLRRITEALSVLATKRKKNVVFVAILLMVVSIIGIPFIKNEIDILNYFGETTSIRQTSALMNKEFGGSIPIQVIIKGDIQDPEVMEAVKSTQSFLNELPNASNAQSVADFIIELNQAMGEGRKVPDNRNKISNLWFLIEGNEMLEQFVHPDKSEAVVQAYMTNTDTRGYHAVDQALDHYISQTKRPGLQLEKSGMASVYANLDKSLMMNLLLSMVISLCLIFICMIFLVKSVKGALLGIVPLAFSMLFVFGFMGAVGIALDIVTVLIASITVGAGIDYSIHFVTAYRRFIGEGQAVDEAIHSTLKGAGRSIIINVITIIIGFLVLIFANLIPLQQFGILIAVTMFVSGFAAISLLPALLSMWQIRLMKGNRKYR